MCNSLFVLRWLLAVLAVVLLLAGTGREALATCGGPCCDTRLELIAWSHDGKTFAVRAYCEEGHEQIRVMRGAKVLRKIGGCVPTESEECPFVGKPVLLKGRGKLSPLQRYPVGKLGKGMLRLSGEWRKSFKSTIVVKERRKYQQVSDPSRGLQQACSSVYDLYREDRLAATLPAACDGAETGWFGARFRGGFLHPSGKYALVKLRDVFERMMSSERYVLIRL